MQQLKEGVDYYINNGLYVFTEAYHLKRGFCCKSGCKHCPYGYSKKIKVAVSWSGGKDSALALYYLLQDEKYQVDHLFTIFDKDLKKVGMHGISEELIEKQAISIGLPLKNLYLQASGKHDNYEILMKGYFKKLKEEQIRLVVFGDIFLEDLKLYRDSILESAGIEGYYPLWKKDSLEVIKEFLNLDFKTIICAGKEPDIKKEQLGTVIDMDFLKNLPYGVDPCGEHGEFHTFVFDGPVFKEALSFEVGRIVEKTYQYKSVNEKGQEVHNVSKFHFQEIF